MAISEKNLATTKDFAGFLEPKQAAPIFEEVAKRSLIQPLAQKIEMGPTGVSIPHWAVSYTHLTLPTTPYV